MQNWAWALVGVVPVAAVAAAYSMGAFSTTPTAPVPQPFTGDTEYYKVVNDDAVTKKQNVVDHNGRRTIWNTIRIES